MSNELKHVGTKEHSGRYPWGSGGDPYQHYMGFRQHVKALRKQGLGLTEIAEGEGIKTQVLRARISLARNEVRAADQTHALRMHDLGYSHMEIGRRMGGINESVVRGLLDPALSQRSNIARATTNMIRESADTKQFIDVGKGVEHYIGISRDHLNKAVLELSEKGYKIHHLRVPQQGMPDKFTEFKVLGAPGTLWKTLRDNPLLIQPITAYTADFGRNYTDPNANVPLKNVSAKQIKVRYAEDGGKDKDGVIELRRGVPDLDLGAAKYAQVRIAVDGTHFLKGMAFYNDKMPAGYDIVFNTNKTKDVPMMGSKDNTVLKPVKKDDNGNVDLANPFGATPKQGGRRGALFVVNEEGDWAEWSKTLSSQVLSKQPVSLAKAQLDQAFKEKTKEYNEIMSVTNPTIKKKLLAEFADDCDSSSVHLKAAALPRQAQKVILPIPGLKENEVYAPDFNDSEPVVLIRHPHGGRFEIPELIVNNKSPAAKAIMKDARDAIGIHPNVAKTLSGADFDGDTVIVIPNFKGLIKTEKSRAFKSLQEFDPITAYPAYPGMPVVASKNGKWPSKQQQMGSISNLITDMTIKGANPDDVVKAVKHSMVIIDAEKHNLNYKQSAKDNQISALSARYQNGPSGGASTLISRAASDKYVNYREEGAKIGRISKTTSKPTRVFIDPKTGEKLYETTGESYNKYSLKGQKIVNPETGKKTTTMWVDPITGEKTYQEKGSSYKKYSLKGLTTEQRTNLIDSKVLKETLVVRKTPSTKMAETPNAFTLSSGRPIEEAYAQYANNLKALGNKSRLETLDIKPTPYSPSANKVYAKEVISLNAGLALAERNKPIERYAQLIANSTVKRKQEANQGMDKEELKKVKNNALTDARTRTGAKKFQIPITDKEWAAIQAGAITPSKLSSIINNADTDRLKALSTPRIKKSLTTTQLNTARSMLSLGRTQAEVSEKLGISISVLNKGLNG